MKRGGGGGGAFETLFVFNLYSLSKLNLFNLHNCTEDLSQSESSLSLKGDVNVVFYKKNSWSDHNLKSKCQKTLEWLTGSRF